MRKADFARRVERLEAAIRPNDSIRERMDALPANQRAIFERWQRRCQEQCMEYETEPGRAYGMLMNAEIDQPEIAHRIHEQVYGRISADISLETLKELYDECSAFAYPKH